MSGHDVVRFVSVPAYTPDLLRLSEDLFTYCFSDI